MNRPHCFGPWRRALQWGLSALLAVTPLVKLHGVALLRLDIPSLTLELVGSRFRIEELYLVWILVLTLLFLFLLMTVILGRVWCGWGCPQTALSDFADWLERMIPIQPLRHLSFLFVSLWLGATFVWYFMEPLRYLRHIADGTLGIWPLGTTLVVAGITLLDLVCVRRLFCKAFCPYGRFQTVLVDKGTLTLQAPGDALARCIDCRSCARVCPTGIDIRKGYQIECINCARCLDACRAIMARRGEEGIIRYTFGLDDLGWRSIVSPKSIALSTMVLMLGAMLLFMSSHRPVANFKIGRSAQLPTRISDNGRQITFFSATLTNRRETEELFTLSVTGDRGTQLTIKGPSRFTLTGNEKLDTTLAVDSPVITGSAPMPITFTAFAEHDRSRISVDSFLTPKP